MCVNFKYGAHILILRLKIKIRSDNMNLMDAIYKRRSIRKYKTGGLSLEEFKKLDTLMKHCPKLYDHIPMDIHVIKEGEKIHALFSGIINSYTKVTAPHYLIITSEDKEGYLENVGFALEHIVLELTNLGIGTCWIGGFDKKAFFKGMIPMAENHIPVIVIAFGHPENPAQLTEVIDVSYKRKSLKEITSGSFDADWTDVMNAVRRAPSGINGQPWRLHKKGANIDMYTIKRSFITKPLEAMNRIDAGIALCHLKIAAECKNKDIEIKKLDNNHIEALNYITSIVEK